jgi:hypothetical protein
MSLKFQTTVKKSLPFARIPYHQLLYLRYDRAHRLGGPACVYADGQVYNFKYGTRYDY